MHEEHLELIFALGGISAKDAWSLLLSILDPEQSAESLCEIDGHMMGVSRVRAYLDQKQHFRIIGRGYSADYSPVANYDHCLLDIGKSTCGDLATWDALVKPFSARSSFVSGRLYDAEYEFWQNAQNPLEFESRGKRWADLRVLREPVFGDPVIDISENPGRRILQDGYVEAVGSIMWFGTLFWDRSGGNPCTLDRADWLKVTKWSGGIVKIQASDNCFRSAKSPEGDLQNRLRALLFPKAEVSRDRLE